jgi:hypothetical protein
MDKIQTAVILANARHMIKACKRTTNQSLVADLFGKGSTTAREICATVGIDPMSNDTSLSKMLDHIRNDDAQVKP